MRWTAHRQHEYVQEKRPSKPANKKKGTARTRNVKDKNSARVRSSFLPEPFERQTANACSSSSAATPTTHRQAPPPASRASKHQLDVYLRLFRSITTPVGIAKGMSPNLQLVRVGLHSVARARAYTRKEKKHPPSPLDKTSEGVGVRHNHHSLASHDVGHDIRLPILHYLGGGREPTEQPDVRSNAGRKRQHKWTRV